MNLETVRSTPLNFLHLHFRQFAALRAGGAAARAAQGKQTPYPILLSRQQAHMIFSFETF
jgi:hypothetical protein